MKGKLLIVEDESLIRKGLRMLIEENALPWDIVGEAGNGIEAKALVESLSPDLVLTDIRMPLMDGLQLSAHLHDIRSGAAVVILTGHKDFSYAQSAVRYGVKAFLLKPCPEEEVCRVLTELHEQWYARLQRARLERLEKLRLEELALRAALLRLPLEGAETIALERELSGREVWYVKVLDYFPAGKAYRKDDLRLLQFSVVNIVEELLRESEASWRFVSVEYDQFVCFLKGDAAQETAVLTARISEALHQFLGLLAFICPCGVAGRLDRLPELYEAGKRQLRARYPAAAAQESDGAQAEAARENQAEWSSERLPRLLNEMTSFILLGKAGELRSYIDDQTTGLLHMPPAEMKLHALAVATAMLEVERKELGGSGDRLELLERVKELHDLTAAEAIQSWLKRRAERFTLRLNQWLTERNDNWIDRAIRYVEEHYMEDCSLAQTAEHVHLSPTYFSNMFKKETGESYVNFVTKVRVDKAKVLLRNTNLKISEIAEAIGFAEASYFATVFRQWTGQSPSDFRKA